MSLISKKKQVWDALCNHIPFAILFQVFLPIDKDSKDFQHDLRCGLAISRIDGTPIAVQMEFRLFVTYFFDDALKVFKLVGNMVERQNMQDIARLQCPQYILEFLSVRIFSV